MDFPTSVIKPTAAPQLLQEALGVTPLNTFMAFDYIVVLDSEAQVMSISPDFMKLATLDLRGVSITAIGDNVDFVSRCFSPKLRVNEDPVTGSTHCTLAPYQANKPKRTQFVGKQLSKQTETIQCEVSGNRVILFSNTINYMYGLVPSKYNVSNAYIMYSGITQKCKSPKWELS